MKVSDTVTICFVSLCFMAILSGCSAHTYVTSEPDGVRISVNENIKGDTPLQVIVPDIMGVGSVYSFKAEKEGFKTQYKVFTEQGLQDASGAVPSTVHFTLLPDERVTSVRRDMPAAVVGKAMKSDIDELPSTVGRKQKNGYAVVIGIESYRQKLPKADFAIQDAKLVSDYLTKSLGYPEENVVTLTNDRAGLGDFVKYFEKWLPNNVESGSTVFVYYSGHGAPNPKTSDAYLVPYDGDPSFIEETGYSLKRMYAALGKLPAKEVIVALDSCFSGAGGRSVIAKGSRPLVMNLKADVALPKNMTVLSASSGDQTSSTYDEKGHGLFTYFMLKGIKNEDVVRKDGSLKIDDLYSYVKPQVERIARKQYNNEQTPQLIEPKRN